MQDSARPRAVCKKRRVARNLHIKNTRHQSGERGMPDMFEQKSVTAVVVAAGTSSRMGFDKLLYRYDGQPVIAHTVQAFSRHPLVDGIIVVTGANNAAIHKAVAGLPKVSGFVPGGATRAASVAAGVAAVQYQDGLVAIQDGARPFVSEAVITEAIRQAARMGGAAPAVPVKDTIKVAGRDGTVQTTPARSSLYAVQTPQVFDLALFKDALSRLTDETVTDDCAVFERAGYTVSLTRGDYANRKITTKEDLPGPQGGNQMHIGHGYDVHRLVEGRDLILGGQKIPYEKGLLGHSDADVLTHAVMDALLGAAALGDIGKHFPDTDAAYAGADSIQLLRRVADILRQAGWQPVNVDATVLCQAPKLAGFIPAMQAALALALGMESADVSVKATTEEKLGFTGAGQGIAAHAVCLIRRL